MMWAEWLRIALCVTSASGAGATAGAVLTTPDVSAKWLEGFRRDLLRETYDYGPVPDPPGPRRGAGGPRGTVDEHEALTGSNGNSSADDAASRELGISRRDLYGPKDGALLSDVELAGPRRPFLENLHELEEQLKPVYVKPGAPNTQTDRRTGFRKSRKRNEDNSIEDVEEKTPYIVQGGIKRYRVHTDPKQRFRNRFGAAESFPLEEWGIKAQEAHGPNVPERENTQNRNDESEDSRFGNERDDERLPYNQGYEDEVRQNGIEDKTEDEDNESHDGKRYNAQQDVHIEQRYQDDRSDSSYDQDSGESVEQSEQDVSEYAQESVRSRYVRRRGGGGGAGYAARSADAFGRAPASRTSCDCGTELPAGPDL